MSHGRFVRCPDARFLLHPNRGSPRVFFFGGSLLRLAPDLHFSLWRESDRTLIVGDAFVTHNVESAYESLLAHAPEIHGPPRYITPDWVGAKRSVETLAALEPELVLTGHGHPLRGPEMRAALHLLTSDFDRIAVPAHGRYVDEPARADENGPTYVPPKK